MLRKLSSRNGFSLIEVLMGAMILVVGFIALIQAITMGSEMIDNARKQQIAQQIIDAEIAHLRLSQWTAVTAPVNSTTYSITINAAGSGIQSEAPTGSAAYFELDANTLLMSKSNGFVVQLTATDVRTDFRQFAYTVTWKSNTGRSYSRTGTAYFGRNGLQLSYQKT